MSAHGHGAHDTASDHETAHDAEDEDAFPADEPHSPGWLPLLGGGLFLTALLLWIAFAPPVAPGTQPSAAAPAAAPAPAARPPSPAPAAPAAAHP